MSRSYPYPEASGAVRPTVYVKALADAVDADVAGVAAAVDGKAEAGHTHDDRYYTEAEADSLLAGKVDGTDPRLSDARTPTAHTHVVDDVSGLAVEVYWSGWRNVTSLRHADMSGGNIFLARTGRLCMLMFHNLTTSTAGHRNIITLPSGFTILNVTGANWRNGEVATDDGVNVRPVSAYAGRMRVLNMPVSAGMGGTVTWLTADNPPASLPGDAA